MSGSRVYRSSAHCHVEIWCMSFIRPHSVFILWHKSLYTIFEQSGKLYSLIYFYLAKKKSFCIDLDKRRTTLHYFLMSLYKMTYHVVEDFITLLEAFKLISHYDLHNFVIFADTLHVSRWPTKEITPHCSLQHDRQHSGDTTVKHDLNYSTVNYKQTNVISSYQR